LQYLSNLHGDHLRLYLRNTQEFHLQTCSQSPRHNGDIARFRLLALGTLASFDPVGERPHFDAAFGLLGANAALPRRPPSSWSARN
jgi:hypothetical protein